MKSFKSIIKNFQHRWQEFIEKQKNYNHVVGNHFFALTFFQTKPGICGILRGWGTSFHAKNLTFFLFLSENCVGITLRIYCDFFYDLWSGSSLRVNLKNHWCPAQYSYKYFFWLLNSAKVTYTIHSSRFNKVTYQ